MEMLRKIEAKETEDRRRVKEGTVHQSAAGDLAIRQGPWKLIFRKSGKHELYNLQTDLSETKDVLAGNPEVVAKLAELMQRFIDDGRSTPGVAQKNDFVLSLTGGKAKGKRNNKGQKTAAESARKMALAADPAFD